MTEQTHQIKLSPVIKKAPSIYQIIDDQESEEYI